MSDADEPQEFDVIVHPLDDGSFWAEVCGQPGCLAQASSYTDILAHIRDAHEACLVALPQALDAEHGGPNPSDMKSARTAGALGKALVAAGWKLAAASKHHHVFAAFGRADCLSVPADPATILNDGYRAAVAKLFG